MVFIIIIKRYLVLSKIPTVIFYLAKKNCD